MSRTQEAAFKQAKAQATPTIEIEKNERLNEKMSEQEYREKYDLDEAEVFQQQAEQLDSWETVLTLLRLAFKEWGVTKWADFHDRMNQAADETNHFKKYIREQMNNE